ncbi:MAG: peptide chain release factor N(5)-glutamine methyltransferase [Terriglobales bacterium]|jgi:release factor glutamine methyltransferase
MRLKPALEAAVRRLEENDVGSARMNAEVLLMFTLSCDRAYLYGHPERELTKDECERFDEALGERSRGVPAQYITGHQEFWGLDLIVNPAVLIPRPETEHVVETVLELVRGTEEFSSRQPSLVDVGTGSGCIALALAKELPGARVWATDISGAALDVARINAVRMQLEERVHFQQCDLLADLPNAAFDFVVSNPPYVGEGEADKVQLEVRKFEPHGAVFAGPEGLDTIARLIPQARSHLQPGGWLVMEIGYTQEAAVRALLNDWHDVRSINDLRGIPRVIAARNP